MSKKDMGFTLIELVVVMMILAVLAIIAGPLYINQIKKAKDGVVYALLGTYRSTCKLYLVDNEGEYPSSIVDIENNVKVSKGNFEIAVGTSGTVSSIQVLAGTVAKPGFASNGYGEFSGESHVAEMYYDSVNGELYIDGTNSGTDYLDTKGEKWNEK